MTWTLTFEGFLFAAIALIGRSGKDLDPGLGWFIKYAIPVLGCLVAFVGLDSVNSAYRAIRELQNFWNEHGDVADFPPVALIEQGRLMKSCPRVATPGYSIPVTIGTAWILLLMIEVLGAAWH